MGGPIPFTAIAEFANIYGIDDFFEFKEIIRMMDDEYLRESEEKRKTEK